MSADIHTHQSTMGASAECIATQFPFPPLTLAHARRGLLDPNVVTLPHISRHVAFPYCKVSTSSSSGRPDCTSLWPHRGFRSYDAQVCAQSLLHWFILDLNTARRLVGGDQGIVLWVTVTVWVGWPQPAPGPTQAPSRSSSPILCRPNPKSSSRSPLICTDCGGQ